MGWLKTIAWGLAGAAVMMTLLHLGIPYGDIAFMGMGLLTIYVIRLEKRIDLLERQQREDVDSR